MAASAWFLPYHYLRKELMGRVTRKAVSSPFPRTFYGIPPETTMLSKSSTLTNVQVRSTDLDVFDPQGLNMCFLTDQRPTSAIWFFGTVKKRGKVCFWSRLPLLGEEVRYTKGLSSSGSNQAREGRLVNALAVRGDEGRDTLR